MDPHIETESKTRILESVHECDETQSPDPNDSAVDVSSGSIGALAGPVTAEPAVSSASPPGRRPSSAKQFLLTMLVLVVGTFCVIAENRSVWQNHTNAGISASASRNFDDAEVHFRKALAEAQQFGIQDSRLATSLSNLAEVYRLKQERSKALSLHLQALAIRKRLFGLNYPDTAASMVNVGFILESKKPREAIQLYEQALAVQEKYWGPNSPVVAKTLESLAAGHEYYNPAVAGPLRERALKIYLQNPSGNRNEVISALYGINDLNLPAPQQKERCRRTAAIIQALCGPNALPLVPVYKQMAEVTEDPLEKERFYKRGAEVIKASFSEEWFPQCRDFFKSWAVSRGGYVDPVIKTDSRVAELVSGDEYTNIYAIEVLALQVKLLEEKLGDSSPLVACARNELACCTKLPLQERLNLCRTNIGFWDSYVSAHAQLWAQSCVSETYEPFAPDIEIERSYSVLRKLRSQETQALAWRELTLWEGALSSNSPKVAERYTTLYHFLPEMNAAQTFDKSTKLWEDFLKKQPNLAQGYGRWALDVETHFRIWRQQQSDRAGIERVLRRQLQLSEQLLGRDHPETARVLMNMAQMPGSKSDAEIRRAISIYARYLEELPADRRGDLKTFRVPIFDFQKPFVYGRELQECFNSWCGKTADPKLQSQIRREQLTTWQRVLGQECPQVALSYLDMARVEGTSASDRKSYLLSAIRTWSKCARSYDQNYDFLDSYPRLEEMFQLLAEAESAGASNAAEQAKHKVYELWLKTVVDTYGQDSPKVAAAINKTLKDDHENLSLDAQKALAARACGIWKNYLKTNRPYAYRCEYDDDINQTFDLMILRSLGNANQIREQQIALWVAAYGGKHAMVARATHNICENGLGLNLDDQIAFLERASRLWKELKTPDPYYQLYADDTEALLTARKAERARTRP